MQVENERISQQHVETFDTLRAIASHLAREGSHGLSSETRRDLEATAKWLEERMQKQARPFILNSKASQTRTRLFFLQLGGFFEKLEHSSNLEMEIKLCEEYRDLVRSQQQRYLYEDMVSCLQELSSLSIERGQGHQAVMFGDMASRLETRLECGHIVLEDDQQRAKDEALYSDLKQKLKAMKS